MVCPQHSPPACTLLVAGVVGLSLFGLLCRTADHGDGPVWGGVFIPIHLDLAVTIDVPVRGGLFLYLYVRL
eukprot:6948042-Pyramimonas_sp.AAC.1